MAVTASRLSLPRVANGSLSVAHGPDRREDWSEIENLLASPVPAHGLRRLRSRRHAVPLVASTAAATAVFVGLLVAVLASAPGRCLRLERCEPPPTASAAPLPVPEAAAAKPLPVAPAKRLADADRSQPEAIAPPIAQGRSVSESNPPGEDAPTIAPRHHGRSHHHHRRLAR